MLFLSFSVAWNVSCPQGEGFVGGGQPSRAWGWDRGGQGMVLPAAARLVLCSGCFSRQCGCITWAKYASDVQKCINVCMHVGMS